MEVALTMTKYTSVVKFSLRSDQFLNCKKASYFAMLKNFSKIPQFGSWRRRLAQFNQFVLLCETEDPTSSFLVKLLTDRQTERQTNAGKHNLLTTNTTNSNTTTITTTTMTITTTMTVDDDDDDYCYYYYYYYYTVSQKNIPDVFSYNSRKHWRIFIIFGRNVTEKASNHMLLYFSTSPN